MLLIMIFILISNNHISLRPFFSTLSLCGCQVCGHRCIPEPSRSTCDPDATRSHDSHWVLRSQQTPRQGGLHLTGPIGWTTNHVPQWCDPWGGGQWPRRHAECHRLAQLHTQGTHPLFTRSYHSILPSISHTVITTSIALTQRLLLPLPPPLTRTSPRWHPLPPRWWL